MVGKKQNLVGQKFGKLTVLKRIEYTSIKKHNKRYVARCVCECGNIKEILVKNLKNGRTKSCGCDKTYYNDLTGEGNGHFKGYKGIRQTYWSRLASYSKHRGHNFSLDIKYGWKLYESQNRKCALTGLPIYFGKLKEDSTASLDRIDISKGYEENNVQWVHKDVNRMRNVYTIEYFIEMCKLVASNNSLSTSSKPTGFQSI